MAGPGRSGPKTAKQKAREANVTALGRAADKIESSGDYAFYKGKMLPKSHTDMRKITAHLNAFIEAIDKNPPKGVSLAHINTFKRLYELAMRDPIENLEEVKCPKCGKRHVVICQFCENPHAIEVPSAQLEKNSIACLLKLSDKFAPNLAAVTQDININFLVTNITEFCIKIISTYVPAEKKPVILQELNATMTKVVDAEYEVDNG